jgi:mannose-6-phosphate isomerase-like protein (cupin superfamily)
MDYHAAKAHLEALYPDAKQVLIVSPDEVIAELGDGVAVAAISTTGSAAHFHFKTKEQYRVLEGQLALIVRGNVLPLEERDFTNIPLRVVHRAQSIGKPWAIVQIRSDPPWSSADHFLA